MSKNKRKASVANLYAMIVQMWADVNKGIVDAERIKVTKYTDRFHVSRTKRSIILPYITQDECPTLEQAKALRRTISECINKHKMEQLKRAHSQDLFDVNNDYIEDDITSIESAIHLLKQNGYIIFKKV